MPNEKPLPGLSTDEKLATLVRDRAEHATNYYHSYFHKLGSHYDLFRGVVERRSQEFRNTMHIPFLFAVIQSHVARKVQTSFGTWPIVTFQSFTEDQSIARKNETLIYAQMKDAFTFEKGTDFYVVADLYGTAIARVGWKRDIRNELHRQSIPLLRKERLVPRTVTRFDGPDWQVIDPQNFWPQPGHQTLHTAGWAIHRYWADFDDLLDRAEAGEFGDTGEARVKRIKETPVPKVPTSDAVPRLGPHRSFYEYEAMLREKYAKPVELREMFGWVPREFAPDGVRFRRVILANNKVVILNEPSPYRHLATLADIFLAYSPQRDPHYFHGIGKAEVVAKAQLTANRIAAHKLDALDLNLSPPTLMDRSLGIDMSNLALSPGRIITAHGGVGEDRIRTLYPDLRGMQAAYTEIAQLWQWIQQGTGIIEDVILGGGSGNRTTAREFLGRQEQALTRLMLEARLAEEGFVEPLANSMVGLNKQWLPVPKQIPILGSRALINPISGLPLPQEPTTINMKDIDHNYKSKAMGATQMMGKAIKQQNYIALLQILSAHPVAIEVVNWYNFFREGFEVFDFKNTNELLNEVIPDVNRRAAAGLTGGTEAAAGTGADTLPQLDPALLSALGGGQNASPIGGIL